MGKCLVKVQSGRATQEFALSRAQQKALCPARLIDCGAFACAYVNGRDAKTVVKFTKDPSDAIHLMQVDGHGAPKVKRAPVRVKTHRPTTVPDEFRDDVDPVYAFIVERVYPLSPGEEYNVTRAWNPDDNEVLYQTAKSIAVDGMVGDIAPGEAADRLLAKALPQIEQDCRFDAACIKTNGKVINALAEVWRRGAFVFDIHKRNVGKREDGEFVILDLGLIARNLGEDDPHARQAATYPVLAGNRPRRKAKRHRRRRS